MSDLDHHTYEVDELVIGNSLEAVSYCYLNEKTLILNKVRKPYFFEFFERGSCLKKYMMESVEYELSTPNGKKFVGSSKLEVWEKLVFYLSLSGLVPLADKVYSVRIDEDKSLKITTANSRVIRVKFNKLRIFDMENIAGFSSFENSDTYKVVDWVDVRSGMKHEYDYFETEDNFVREVYFYPSQRMGSGEKDYRKDLVSISHLTKDQLDDFEYSDTYVKFKVLSLMKEAGIKGPKNGRRWDDPNKWAYHSIKIEPSSRDVCASEKSKYERDGAIMFDDRGEREIYRAYEPKNNYLYKINEQLK